MKPFNIVENSKFIVSQKAWLKYFIIMILMLIFSSVFFSYCDFFASLKPSATTLIYITTIVVSAYLIGCLIKIAINVSGNNDTSVLKCFSFLQNLKNGFNYLVVITLYGFILFFILAFLLIYLTNSQGPIMNIAIFVVFLFVLYIEPAVKILCVKNQVFTKMINPINIYNELRGKDYLKLVLITNVLLLGVCFFLFCLLTLFFVFAIGKESLLSFVMYYFMNFLFLIIITFILILSAVIVGQYTKFIES